MNNRMNLINIKNQITKHFTKSDWLYFSYTLCSYDVIEVHPRLLRILSFGDDDYEGNIFELLNEIIKKDPKSFNVIKSHLSDKISTPVVFEVILTSHNEAPKKVVTFLPQVFDIPNKPQNDMLVNVMLPFKQLKSFEAGKQACRNLYFDCAKADDIWGTPTFIQDDSELILISRVVVDFRGKNPNVFYEVRIAHTLGKTVVPITQSLKDVPSDLGHHRALL